MSDQNTAFQKDKVIVDSKKIEESNKSIVFEVEALNNITDTTDTKMYDDPKEQTPLKDEITNVNDYSANMNNDNNNSNNSKDNNSNDNNEYNSGIDNMIDNNIDTNIENNIDSNISVNNNNNEAVTNANSIKIITKELSNNYNSDIDINLNNKNNKTSKFDETKLQTNVMEDVDIGLGNDEAPISGENAINAQTSKKDRMPSISFKEDDNDLAEIRRASRRKWWSPTRLCDWCMHNSIFGKLFVILLTWTTVMDYTKDIYVACHLGVLQKWWELIVTLIIMFLSLRLMLYIKASDDRTVEFRKLFLYYLPGSVYADFQIDRLSDAGVCVAWEFFVLLGTPLVPLFLTYLAVMKSISLLSCDNDEYDDRRNEGRKKENFEHPHLLAYSVIEAIFETFPQLIFQSYLYFNAEKGEIQLSVFYIAWIVSGLVLIKIPVILWYNWRIVHNLEFKRHHTGEIMSIRFHPVQDIISTCSWDHTILINNVISIKNNILKAKRVLDHHYNVNDIQFYPKFINTIDDKKSDLVAVAGQGIEIFNWRTGQSLAQFPKKYERDKLRRKKRMRTKEVTKLIFSNDGKRIIFCQGKNLFIYDWYTKKEINKIKVCQGDRVGDLISIDISPNNKYVCCGLYQGNIKIYNSYNKDIVRQLKGHTSTVNCVKFDRKGQFIVSGSSDCTVRIWDFKYGIQLKQFNQHTSEVLCLAIDYTNRYICSAGRDRIVHLMYTEFDKYRNNNKNGKNNKNKNKNIINDNKIIEIKKVSKFIPFKTKRDIRCIDISPYGDHLACGTEDHQLYLIPLPSECKLSILDETELNTIKNANKNKHNNNDNNNNNNTHESNHNKNKNDNNSRPYNNV